jgi:DNA-binding transcriptional regulator YiaG
MANITSILNDQIRRLSRREIKSQTKTTKKLTAQYRRDIAALKRQVAQLSKTVAFLEAQEKQRVAEQPVPEEIGDIRFRADGLKSHRARLGLSAKDYGVLVGVTGQTIYDWELGKSRPRKEQVAKVAAVRGIGKREAFKRLELLGIPTAGKRGEYSETAEEFIASLVKSRQATTSAQINAAWKNSGRPGKADNTLSRMVKAKKLQRVKAQGLRGSKYAGI